MLKVVHIISDIDHGGAQKIIINYLQDLQYDKKIKLYLLVLGPKINHEYNKIIEKCNVEVTYLDSFINLSIPWFFKRIAEKIIINKRVNKYLKAINPEIVHIHLYGTLFLTINSIHKCRIPLKFYTLHSDPLRFNNYKLKVLKDSFSKFGVIPICVTEEQAIVAKKHYGFKRYEIVHNGVDFKNIKSRIISQNEARKLFGLEKNDFVISAVGRLTPIKRYDLLIKIFSKVMSILPDAKLLIAGSGNELDKLKELANSLGLANSVLFLGEIKNTVELYCASNVVAITSESESASLVLLEAQACGIKCVISDGTPTESIITNKVIKMRKDASIDEWASEIINGNNYSKNKYSFKDYDEYLMSAKIKEIYLKYWEAYKNDKE